MGSCASDKTKQKFSALYVKNKLLETTNVYFHNNVVQQLCVKILQFMFHTFYNNENDNILC